MSDQVLWIAALFMFALHAYVYRLLTRMSVALEKMCQSNLELSRRLEAALIAQNCGPEEGEEQ